MSLRDQLGRLKRRGQEMLEELWGAKVSIDGGSWLDVAASGIRNLPSLEPGREVDDRELTLRLRRELHPTEPAEGTLLRFRDEYDVETDWRIAEVRRGRQEGVWWIRCEEPDE